MSIIKSLLDTDFYKLTMMQAVFHNYTGVHVKYKFSWRNWENMKIINYNMFIDQIKKEIDNLCSLKFGDDELEYLRSIPFFKDDFIEFLRVFNLNSNYVKVGDNQGKIDIEIEGPWLNTILFEVPILAIVSELYTNLGTTKIDQEISFNSNIRYIDKVIDYLNYMDSNKFGFGGFGTRRRSSRVLQHNIVSKLSKKLNNNNLVGTSNVYFAKECGIKPLGTHAHEWFQAHQQLTRLIDSQSAALQKWADEYRGDLGIALTDTLGFDAFLKDFDKYFAKLFDGCRHDSGDPYKWTDKLLAHYKKLGINPKTKTALYSDNLNVFKAFDLFKMYNSEINTAFGIGTNLTNNCGFEAPQIVIKMVECNGFPVAKISDSTGKSNIEPGIFSDQLNEVIKFKLNED